MDCGQEVSGLPIRLAVVLRTTVFLENEWPAFLPNYAITPNDIVIVGDMNFHLNVVDDRDAQRFISVLYDDDDDDDDDWCFTATFVHKVG